jgi:methionyl-tRNA formyltransferase
MRLEEGLDTGPVYAERRMSIGAGATTATLQPQLAQLGAQALLEVIADLDAGRAVARAQAGTGATYARKISKDEARVDWSMEAQRIERQVRAFDPWPVAETLLHGERLRIWSARALFEASGAPGGAAPGTVLGLRDDGLQVACGSGALLITSLQPPGKRVMSAAEFLRGYGQAPVHFS